MCDRMAQSLWLLALVFLSGHPAAQLECPPDKEVPLWNQIHLRKRRNFIAKFCPGIQLPGWRVLQTENCHYGTTSSCAKGHFLLAVVILPSSLTLVHFFLSEHPLPSWSALQTETYHCGTTSTCRKAVILFAMVFLSIRPAAQLQSVLLSETHHCGFSVEPHPPAQKGQFYLLWHSSHDIEQPSWSTLQSETRQLWNHIHLHKSGNFICHGTSVRLSSCPAGVSSRQRGTTVEPHPPAQKR